MPIVPWYKCSWDARLNGIVEIIRAFTISERERFHNLLKLAAESPFEGERNNALAAAERLAGKCGMTLEDAAISAGAGALRQEPPVFQDNLETRFAGAIHLMDYHLHIDKTRREAALKAAIERGLVWEDPPRPEISRNIQVSRTRMNPLKHAAVLLKETSLPFQEVARITGLDVYQVVGMKLKMRSAA